MPASTPRMTMTISSSIRVKPLSFSRAARICSIMARFLYRWVTSAVVDARCGEPAHGPAERVVRESGGQRHALVDGRRHGTGRRQLAVHAVAHDGVDLPRAEPDRRIHAV